MRGTEQSGPNIERQVSSAEQSANGASARRRMWRYPHTHMELSVGHGDIRGQHRTLSADHGAIRV